MAEYCRKQFYWQHFQIITGYTKIKAHTVPYIRLTSQECYLLILHVLLQIVVLLGLDSISLIKSQPSAFNNQICINTFQVIPDMYVLLTEHEDMKKRTVEEFFFSFFFTFFAR